MSNLSSVTPQKLGGSRNPSVVSKTPKAVTPASAASSRAGKTPAKTDTPASNSVTPADKSTTPSVKSTTPAAKSTTPAAKSATPGTKTVTPAAKTATPGAKSATPAAKSVTPASKSTTPAAKSETPAAKNVTPAAEAVTPVTPHVSEESRSPVNVVHGNGTLVTTKDGSVIGPIGKQALSESSDSTVVESKDHVIGSIVPPSIADSEEEGTVVKTAKTADTGSRRSILKTPRRASSQASDHTEVATTSLLSVNEDGKSVSINPDPEVFYVERDGSGKQPASHQVIEVESAEDEDTIKGSDSDHGSTPTMTHHTGSGGSAYTTPHSASHHSVVSSHHSVVSSHHTEQLSHHSVQSGGVIVSPDYTALVIENPVASPEHAISSTRSSVKHGVVSKQDSLISHRSSLNKRSGSVQSSVHGSINGSVHGGSLHGGSLHGGSLHGGSLQAGSIHGGSLQAGSIHGGSLLHGGSANGSVPITHHTSSITDDTSLHITPMIQPLSQTDSILNTKDVVDPFKAFARKIATQFTPEDISAVHYLANIPERIQGKLTTGVALINYLTNNRRMNIEFLTILLEEMERVDLLEELLAWVQDREQTARAAQKRGQRVGIAGPTEDESTFITVAQRMRDRIMDPGTLVRGCEELVNLMNKVRAQVAECSVSIVLAAMRHHIMSEPVQEAGCVTLANICYHHRTLHAPIVMQGGIRHIQLAIRSHVSNDLVQRAACGAIANLSLRYDDIRKQCVSDGVLKNIINAMSAHKEEVEVQEQGCCALCNLATNQPEIQQKIADTGGLECIITALKVHKTDEMVVGNALTALQMLCSFNKAVQEQAHTLHGMDYAINAMLVFPDSDIVMEAATGVLGNMCSQSSKNRVKAGKNGAIKVSIDALKTMSSNEDVVTRALIMLTNVCFNNDLNRIIAKKLGAVEAIVIGMKGHPESAKVQRQACRAISNICIKNVDLKQEVLSHGLIDHVVQALSNHIAESRVVESVLSALYSLCVYHGLRQEIDETRVEDVITRIREHYPPDSEVHEKATLAEAELKSDENCFGFIGNWRRMSHAIWGGGDTIVDDVRLDKTPGTTIPQQAKSAMSAKYEDVKSRASTKYETAKSRASNKINAVKVKVKEAPIGSKSPKITPDVDVEAGLATSGHASATNATSGMMLPPSSKATSDTTETPTTEPTTSESPSTHVSPIKPLPFQDIPKSSAPASRAPSKPGSTHPSPGGSRKQSRAEQAEEAMAARSHAASSQPVKSGAPTPGEKGEQGSDAGSISPSQRFTPNRGLTHAEIF